MIHIKIYFLIIFLNCLSKSNATLSALNEVIDFSSVDFTKHQYFKNLPSQNLKGYGKVNFLLEHFQKKKAVLDYFENLFFGNSLFTPESEIIFDPYFGRAWRPYYANKYGWRGQDLIDALGKGYSLAQLRKYGAIPQEFEAAWYPS